MKKKLFKIIAGLLLISVLVFVSVALINQFVDVPVAVEPKSLIGKTALFQKAAPIIQESCLNCHSSKTQLPWYAQLPPAKQIITHNVEEALEEVDLEKALFTTGQKPSLKLLKHIQSEVDENAMPPLEYKALHWKAILSSDEKRAIFDWISEEQSAQ